MLTSTEDVKEYVLAAGLMSPQEEIAIESLEGGVSCMVWKIVNGKTRLVLKQALAKLNVKADWYSDVERIVREEQAMSFLQPLLPPDSIPQIVHENSQEHLYVMTCAPEGAMNWKSLLMEGQFTVEVARNAGILLCKLHANSRTVSVEQIKDFQDLRYFEQLRLEPFYTYLKHQHKQLEHEIEQLMRELTECSICMVHGDFSPKNMLVDDCNQVILLDYEVAHWGNPVFDVAFMLSHLLLKGWGLQREQDCYPLIVAFMEQYDLELVHLLSHIGLLLLARLDGKSPVDYIKDDQLKDKIRSIAIGWIQSKSDADPLALIGIELKGETGNE